VRVRALSIHADYACRHSGACCSSGWEIPVEPDAEARIRAGIGAERLAPPNDWAVARPGLPHGARVALRVRPAGDCVFLEPGEPRLCAVQHRLGEPAMPPSCRQFPRVATLTPLGVSVTLSHYCPTAAAMLFRDDVPLAVVSDPPAFPTSRAYEGLDARAALPPLLRPGVLMDWPSLERWEAHAVALLDEPGVAPEEALDRLADDAERARLWTPAAGPFAAFFERVLDSRASAPGTGGREPGPRRAAPAISAAAALRLVVDCVPPRARRMPDPGEAGAIDADRVAALGRELAAPARRWLAAKAFASWSVLQGDGLRTSVLALRVALGVLRAEAARVCGASVGPLDAELLKQAVRRADLLLVHLVDPEALARRLSRCESAGAE
jgi:Fe-S-cluster containining protein